MFRYHMTRVSQNRKTGPIPTSVTSRNSCPDDCGMKDGCYGEGGPVLLHWNKVSKGERGTDLPTFCAQIKELPKHTLWRHNVVGDLPHKQGRIDIDALGKIVFANKGKRGFTYTHHELEPYNLAAIRLATRSGFTINLSCDTVPQAVQTFKQYKLPTCVVLPMDAPNVQEVTGLKIVACPAEKTPKVRCANCALCYDANRDYIIGFRAHGTYKKKADIIARST